MAENSTDWRVCIALFTPSCIYKEKSIHSEYFTLESIVQWYETHYLVLDILHKRRSCKPPLEAVIFHFTNNFRDISYLFILIYTKTCLQSHPWCSFHKSIKSNKKYSLRYLISILNNFLNALFLYRYVLP